MIRLEESSVEIGTLTLTGVDTRGCHAIVVGDAKKEFGVGHLGPGNTQTTMKVGRASLGVFETHAVKSLEGVLAVLDCSIYQLVGPGVSLASTLRPANFIQPHSAVRLDLHLVK